MFMRALSAILLGGGVGFPTATVIVNNNYSPKSNSFIPQTLRDSTSKFELQWMGKNLHSEVGELINGLGKIINNNSNKKELMITGIQLTTSGEFDQNICKKVGFNSEEKGGINCFVGIK